MRQFQVTDQELRVRDRSRPGRDQQVMTKGKGPLQSEQEAGGWGGSPLEAEKELELAMTTEHWLRAAEWKQIAGVVRAANWLPLELIRG